MKKNYFLILGLCLGAYAFGQKGLVTPELQRSKLQPNSKVNPMKGMKKKVHPGVQDKAGETIFSEDFDGSIGSFTTSGTNADVWKFDTNGPNGFYSNPATQIIESTTAANGFMIFDTDFENNQGQSANSGNANFFVGSLVSPVIDLSNENSGIVIKFEHAYRTCCSSSWFPMLELSTDGFQTSEVIDVTIGQTGVNDIGEEVAQYNITRWLETATNKDKFQFRFTFDGEGGQASHYYWQIDDVALIRSFDFDLQMEEMDWGYIGPWDIQAYHQIPESQIAPIAFEAVIWNNGGLDANDATFRVRTTDGSFDMSIVDTIGYAARDTFTIEPGFTPTAGTHTYELLFESFSGHADPTPDNNDFPSELVTMTKNIYAADNNFVDNAWDRVDNGAPQPFEVGNVFQMFGDATLHGVTFRLDGTSDPGTKVYARLYDMDLGATDFQTVWQFNDETPPYEITAGDVANRWVTIPMNSPIDLTNGSSYLLVLGTFADGADDTGMSISTAGISRAGNSILFDSDGRFYWISETPMVRMNFDSDLHKPTITANAPTAICEGDEVTLISSAPTGNVWSNGQTTRTITVSAAGTYTVTANGSTSESVTVSVNPKPQAPTLTADFGLLCQGGSVTITSTSAAEYLWSTGENTQSITVDKAGTYAMLVGDGKCNSDVVTYEVMPSTVHQITSNGPTTFCADGSVILSSSSTSGNVWSTGETTQSIQVTTAATISLIVEEGGCSTPSSDTITTNISSTPVLTLGTVTEPTVCGNADGQIELTGTDSGDLTWTGPVSGSMTGVTLPQTLTGLSAGSYTVMLDNGAGCTYTSSFSINDPAAPTAPMITVAGGGNAQLCDGGSIMLVSSESNDIMWSTGETNDTITVSAAGDYTVRAGVSGSCISNSAVVSVSMLTSPNVKAGADVAICMGESVTLNGAGAQTYSWDNGISDGVAFAPVASGNYAVTGTGFNGCTGTDTVMVTVNALPTITAGDDVAACLGTETTLVASGAGTIPEGASYVWSNGASVPSTTVNPTSDKIYIVTGTDPNGCSNTDTVMVTVNPIPVINFQPIPNLVCIYNDTVFDLVATPAGGTFDGTGVTGTQFVVSSVSNEAVITVSYTVAENGCSATASQNIFVSECLGVEEGTLVDLNIYPNPNKGSFTVSSDKLNDYDVIELKDQLGRVVGSWNIDQTTMEINARVAAGNYNVVLKGKKGSVVTRMVIMD
ncbi:MAG: T9SS type A sorting domain-containing protein [Bacteroidetes bacterium]|nr:MAG: T9SS type A sorting domain-containing protein [Bacteroidota bacterium]